MERGTLEAGRGREWWDQGRERGEKCMTCSRPEG